MADFAFAAVADLRRELALPTQADEERLRRVLEDVSEAIEQYLGREIAPRYAVRLLRGSGERTLWVPDIATLMAVDVDADGDGTYEVSVPVSAIRRVMDGTATVALVLGAEAPVSTWPAGEETVRITAVWGYGDVQEGAGTLPAAVGATDTTLPLVAGVSPGQTLVVDAERMYVLAVDTGASTMDVVRGVRGWGAAAHAAGATVQRERYPGSIRRAAILQAGRMLREATQAYAVAGGGDIAGPVLSSAYPLVRDLLAPYRRRVVGVG